MESAKGNRARKYSLEKRSLPSLVQLLMRLGAAKTAAGRAFQFVRLQVPKELQEVTRETLAGTDSKALNPL
jgi:hypothetical protein